MTGMIAEVSFILNSLSDEELSSFAEGVVKRIENYLSAPFRETEKFKQLVDDGKWPVEDERDMLKLKDELEKLINDFKNKLRSYFKNELKYDDVVRERGKVVNVLLNIIWKWHIIQCSLIREGLMKVKYVGD